MAHSKEVEAFVAYATFVYSRAKKLGALSLDLHHATTGMATEAGEALGITKKLWIYGDDLNKLNKAGVTNYDHLIEEIGDILFYIQQACNLLGTNIPYVLCQNIEKLEKRYPSGYSDAAALARADKVNGED